MKHSICKACQLENKAKYFNNTQVPYLIFLEWNMYFKISFQTEIAFRENH